jgi:hypothetical protein
MKKALVPATIVLFLILSVVFYLLCQSKPNYNFNLLMGGNIIMALITLLSYFIVKKNVGNRPQAFVRGVFSGTLLKMFICISAILAYVMINKPNVHKPSLFVLFGIYAAYTFMETIILSRIAREHK